MREVCVFTPGKTRCPSYLGLETTRNTKRLSCLPAALCCLELTSARCSRWKVPLRAFTSRQFLFINCFKILKNSPPRLPHLISPFQWGTKGLTTHDGARHLLLALLPGYQKISQRFINRDRLSGTTSAIVCVYQFLVNLPCSEIWEGDELRVQVVFVQNSGWKRIRL